MNWTIAHQTMKDALYKIKKENYISQFTLRSKIVYIASVILLFLLSIVVLLGLSNSKNMSIICILSDIVLLVLFGYFVIFSNIIEVLKDIKNISKEVEHLYFTTGVLLDFVENGRNPIAEVETKDGIFIVSTFCGVNCYDIGSNVIIFSSDNKGFERPYRLDNKVAIITRNFEKYEFTC